jgi:hypothetical protein
MEEIPACFPVKRAIWPILPVLPVHFPFILLRKGLRPSQPDEMPPYDRLSQVAQALKNLLIEAFR